MSSAPTRRPASWPGGGAFLPRAADMLRAPLNYAIVVLVAMLVALLLSSILAMNVTDQESERPRFMVLSVLAMFAQREMLALAVLLAGLVSIQHWLYRPLANVPTFQLREVMNRAVCLSALSPFLLFFRDGFVSISLLMMHPLGRWRPRARGAMRGVVLVGCGFVGLMAIGLWRTWTDADPIRANVPITIQLNRTLGFVHGLIVYYTIKRNDWNTAEYERFFKWMFLPLSLVAIESMVTFYAGIGPGVALIGQITSVSNLGLFDSMFIGNYHLTGRLGLMMLFMSIYFYAKERRFIYLTTGILAVVVLFATVNRQVIIPAIFGVGFFIGVRYWGRAEGQKALALVVVILMLAVTTWVTLWTINVVSDVRRTGLSVTMTSRAVLTMRAVDVALYAPLLGTGPLLTTYYLGSSLVPTTVSGRLMPYLYNSSITGPRALGFLLPGLPRMTEYTESVSVHNLWLAFVLEWGFLGLLCVLYVAWRGCVMTLRLLTASLSRLPRVEVTQTMALLSLALALSISMLFTNKFASFAHIVVLFLFLQHKVAGLLDGWQRGSVPSTLSDSVTTEKTAWARHGTEAS